MINIDEMREENKKENEKVLSGKKCKEALFDETNER